jgi:GNAT superfamily N-acetyltransferase
VPDVRLAEPQDADDVTRLMLAFRDHLGLSAPTDDEMRAGVERLLGDRDTEFLLAAADDDGGGVRAAGVAQLRFRYGVWRAGGDCLLEDLYVDEAARGAGLGRALVEATIARARARGCRRVELDTNERNDAALRLYGSFGFSATANGYGGRDLYLRLHLD